MTPSSKNEAAKKNESGKKNDSTKMIRIQQIRSGIGCPREMRETLRALGLGKIRRIITSRIFVPSPTLPPVCSLKSQPAWREPVAGEYSQRRPSNATYLRKQK